MKNKFSKTVENVEGAGKQLTDAVRKIDRYVKRMELHIEVLEQSSVLKSNTILRNLLIERQRRALQETHSLKYDWDELMNRFRASNPSFVTPGRIGFVLSVLQDMPHPTVPPFKDILPKRTESIRLRVPPSRVTGDRTVGHPASQEKEGDLITSLI